MYLLRKCCKYWNIYIWIVDDLYIYYIFIWFFLIFNSITFTYIYVCYTTFNQLQFSNFKCKYSAYLISFNFVHFLHLLVLPKYHVNSSFKSNYRYLYYYFFSWLSRYYQNYSINQFLILVFYWWSIYFFDILL